MDTGFRRYDGFFFRLQRLVDFTVAKSLNSLRTRNPQQYLPLPGEPPVVDHQSAVLDDFDARLGEDFSGVVVANAGLKPD